MSSNVVLITIDSLRADGIGSRSYTQSTTPTLDALATDGASFSQTVANGPNTPSSFPSILTSTYQLAYGGCRYLHEDRPFIARTLRNAGFKTVGYHSNPFLGTDHNYDVGFESFNDSVKGSQSVASVKEHVEHYLDPNSLAYRILRRVWHMFTLSTDTAAYAKASNITDDALNWLKNDWEGDEPFFMWLHYMDVHYPFMPPADAMEALGIDPLPKRRVAELNGKMQEHPDSLSDTDIRDLLDLYHAEIRYTDRNIGRLIDWLERENIREETIVIATADHGEAFGEHDRFGHHPYVYDELLRVPLIISAPGHRSSRIDKQVSTLDIGPTIYDLTGVDIPNRVQGRSLLPMINGEDVPELPVISASGGGNFLAYRTSKWKCFWHVTEGRVELFDLEADPEEAYDLSERHPDRVDRYKKRLVEYRNAGEQTDVDVPEVDPSSATQKRLRDLGYME